MRVVIGLLALLLVGAIARPMTQQAAPDWEAVIEQVRKSTGRVSTSTVGGVETCTAFSIHEEKTFWMTAAHCVSDTMFVDGQVAWTVLFKEAEDIAVLLVPGASKPALCRADEVRIGQPVADYGFGHGWEVAQIRAGAVSAVDLTAPDLEGARFAVFDFPSAPGTSGGPVVDEDGCVVSVMQRSNPFSGASLGIPLTKMVELTGQFWE